MVENQVENARRYWLFFSYCINKWELTCLQTADSGAVGSPRPCYGTLSRCSLEMPKITELAASESTTHRTSTDISKCCQVQQGCFGRPKRALRAQKEITRKKNGLATAEKSPSHPLQEICVRVQVRHSGLVGANTRSPRQIQR